MQPVVRTPIAMLAAEGPKGAREGAAAEGQQGAEGLLDGALSGAGLGKSWNPGAEDEEQSIEQVGGGHVSSLNVKHK